MDFLYEFFANPQAVLTGLFATKLALACVIIFLWCMLEGELALILAGLAAHSGHIHIGLIVFIAGCGGFAGDQVYFYIGRFCKGYVQKKLASQRRKFAIAQWLLRKYGWWIIFVQRYMYGFRTIIPMSIGVTNYSAKKFGLINFVSGQAWAAITVILAYIFGDEIWALIHWGKEHWYLAIPLVCAFVFAIFYAFRKLEHSLSKKRGKELKSILNEGN